MIWDEVIEHSEENQLENWRRWIQDRVMPARLYFSKMIQKHAASFNMIQSAQYLLPWRLREMNPDVSTIRAAVRAFPYVTDSFAIACGGELNAYLSAAGGVATDCDIVEFWNSHRTDLPYWSALFTGVGLLQPSSAAAERVFSMVTSSFGSLLDASEEHMEAAIMTRANLLPQSST